MKTNRLFFVIPFTMLISLFVFTACDHTDLSGSLELRSNDFMVGEQIPIVLTVPDELSEIHKLLWDIDYDGTLEEDAPDMIYGGDVLEDVYSKTELESMFGKNYNLDRIAVFIPIQEGTYTIICDGYYKQTNPQPITEITVTIGTSPVGNGIHVNQSMIQKSIYSSFLSLPSLFSFHPGR